MGSGLTDDKKLSLKRPKHLDDAAELAIIAQLDKMHAAGLAYRDKVAGVGCRRWKHYTDFALGNHWDDYDGNLQVLYTDNRLGSNLRTKADLVNEMHIAAEFHPREPQDQEASALMNAVVKYYWEYLEVPETLDCGGMVADRIGTGIFKVSWDPHAGELGDPRIDHIPSENIVTEPGKRKFDHMRWMCEDSWLDPKEAETKYGALPDDIGSPNPVPDMGDMHESAVASTTGSMKMLAAAGEAVPSTTTGKVPADSFFSTTNDAEKVHRQEWYVRDDAIEVTEGDEGAVKKAKKYPNGRFIVRIGSQIVEDKPFPYEHGKWPYARDVDELDPKNFWADTSVRRAIPVQKEHNVCFTIMANNMHLNTSTPWMNPFNSGVSNADLQTKGSTGGAVINHRPNAEPKRMPPAAISNALFEWYDRTKNEIDELMQIQDVVPPGARGYPSSGEVIEQLRESQLVKVRARANNRARCVRRIVMLLGATIAQFYTEKRYIRITGPLPEALQHLAADSIGNDEGPVRPNGKDGYFIEIDPKAISAKLDTEIRDAVWEPLSKKAQIDQLSDLMEKQGAVAPDAPIQPSDLLPLMQLGVFGDVLRRKIEKREADLAAAPPEPPPGPDPMAGGDPSMMGGPPMPMGPMPGPMPQGPPMGGMF